MAKQPPIGPKRPAQAQNKKGQPSDWVSGTDPSDASRRWMGVGPFDVCSYVSQIPSGGSFFTNEVQLHVGLRNDDQIGNAHGGVVATNPIQALVGNAHGGGSGATNPIQASVGNAHGGVAATNPIQESFGKLVNKDQIGNARGGVVATNPIQASFGNAYGGGSGATNPIQASFGNAHGGGSGATNPIQASFGKLVNKDNATKVEKLRPDMSDVTLTVKVVSTTIVGRKGRPGGPRSHMQFADCLVGDETGVIIFRATNDQVDLMKVGLTVTLQNAKVDMFKDSMRLVVDESGSVQVAEPAGFTVKEDSNLSLIQASFGNVNKDQKKEGPRELEVYEQGMPKTELCLNWQDSGYCRCKDHCKFAHGMEELRPVNRHPLYKTEVCKYWLAGLPCGFGRRCHFRHTLT